ncbi:hypothetical protein MNAN1_002929 [Malassezia nana]|uniref:Apoptogenic protein 1, mitochondrial n=1 Tax=Malassezia nana TaxID=180528 RepID=A0AAF0J398_9BASI|nr:hypothetical protein MNAN1_002929 [Malassezia nana]
MRVAPPVARASRWWPQAFVRAPDPVSNLRPVVYREPKARPTTSIHPYSLEEFTAPAHAQRWSSPGALVRYAERLRGQLDAVQMHARLQSMWLDQFNQRFWFDNNVRFTRALQEYKAEVAPEGDASLERLAPFYRDWLVENAARLRHYNRTLWIATYKTIGAQLRLALLQGYTRWVVWCAGL